MILAKINGNSSIYYSWDVYHRDTFNPDTEIDAIIELGRIKGRNYSEKKAHARDIAIEYSNNSWEGLYQSEMIEIENYFETIGKRFGLLTEFRENAIC